MVWNSKLTVSFKLYKRTQHCIILCLGSYNPDWDIGMKINMYSYIHFTFIVQYTKLFSTKYILVAKFSVHSNHLFNLLFKLWTKKLHTGIHKSNVNLDCMGLAIFQHDKQLQSADRNRWGVWYQQMELYNAPAFWLKFSFK